MRKLVVVLAGIGLVAAGCGGDGGGGEPAPIALTGATNNRGTRSASGSMDVELDEFSFRPTFIKAKPGQRIEIELKNQGEAVHTFTSPDLGNVDEQLAGGASKKITVTAPQRGHALFVCRFHQSQGMQGAVVIA